MAAVSTPARLPFGVLNDSKLRNLQSIKNRQNALTPNSAPLKRRAPSPGLSDSENVEPAFWNANVKRKRASFEDDVSLAKLSRSLNTPVTEQCPPTKLTKSSVTPPAITFSKTLVAPLSAPPAAGRSPPRANRSLPRQRFVPPTLGGKSPSFSIAAALKGTLSQKRSRPLSQRKKAHNTLDDSQPRSWFFDIFEESDEVQDYKMCEWTMTQSSAALDISDDEGKAAERHDRGKENIDPNTMFTASAPVTRSMAAAAVVEASLEKGKEAMDTKEPRIPLGDLNPADHYAEGLDATSVVLVDDESHEGQEEADAVNDTAPAEASPQEKTPATDTFTFDAPVDLSPLEAVPEWAQKSTLSLDVDDQACKFADADDELMPNPTNEPVDIQIWESESAKDASSPLRLADDDQENGPSGFCLQDL